MHAYPIAFLADSIGIGEILVVLLVVLVLFGPHRLPEIARTIGRTMAELRRATDDFKDQLMNSDREPGRNEPEPPEPDGAEAASPPAKPETPAPEAGGPPESEHHDDLAG